MVPRAAFAGDRSACGRGEDPLITTNRINTPGGRDVLASGCADMVSMARPFLADPFFVEQGRRQPGGWINTCIACNQACLDHIFKKRQTDLLPGPDPRLPRNDLFDHESGIPEEGRRRRRRPGWHGLRDDRHRARP